MMITKKYIKGLQTYYSILRHIESPFIIEEKFILMINKLKIKPKDFYYETLLKIENEQFKKYMSKTSSEKYKRIINGIENNNSIIKEFNNKLYKLTKNILIIEFENKDKLYFKITEKESIRFLAAIIEKKKVKGNLVLKNVSELEIFVFNYKLNCKYDTKGFKEVIDILK